MKTRIFFATDFHGSETCFKKFTNAPKYYGANVLILGGDITGKLVVPIVEQKDGTFEADHMGTKVVLRKENELEALEKNIRTTGAYSYRTNPEEMEELRENKDRVESIFRLLVQDRIREWVKIAEERLKNTGVKCYINPGNDDSFHIDSILEESDYIIVPEGRVISLDERHEMISTGYTNITPWHCPRDVTEEELANKINAMASEVERMENCVFNFHCPPYNTPIDIAPKLDESLKYVMTPGGEPEKVSAGSTAIREAIEKHQPLLGLHGHIHESKGFVKIGRTRCLNPGSEYTEGILHGVFIALDKDARDFLFTEG